MTLAYGLRHVSTVVVIALAVILSTQTADAATKKYKVRVESAPAGATLYIDSKDKGAVGRTPWEGSLTKGKHTLIVELEGYKPATRQITVVRSRKLQEVFMPLERAPEPPRIDIRADADKNVFGAQVYVDGLAQGQVPTLVTTDPGRHHIQIRKEGFETFETYVEIKENERVTLTPFLKEVAKAKTGVIVVEADVDNAEVLLDGNPAGTTPTVINDALEGLHVVEVRKEPAIPWKQTVQVIAGQQTKVRAELKATIGGQGGTVRVLSNVQGAHVFLDGTDMGEVPVDIKDVKPGEHVIEVRAPKYQTREERVTVNAGSSTVLKLDLNKQATAEAKIDVVSAVPGADVYIDGASVGKVPVEGYEVSSGEHFVIVKLDGYKTFETKVRVEAGQTRKVPAELRPVGRLRVISDPAGATVLINGIAQETKTPLELNELEAGETYIKVLLAGYEPQEQKVTVVGGKPMETLNFNLTLEGMTPDELLAQQRGLSSFGARTLPRGNSTIDVGIGYPYLTEARVGVGAGKAGNFGFDANVGVRSFFARSELGLGIRFMLVDNEPFSFGAFSDFWYGTKLLDNSKRNGVTWNAGVAASLTALTHVTVSGRLYLNTWSDRHCPEITGSGADTRYVDSGEVDALQACDEYLAHLQGNTASPERIAQYEEVTGQSGADFFTRENGSRLMTSVVAEVATSQRWNLYFMLEGAPFQGERALFTDPFARPMASTDYSTYARIGATYKF